MTDFTNISLADARRKYLETSTTAMPIGGFIAWSTLAVLIYIFGDTLPSFAPFIAAAIPFPLAILIDKIRGAEGLSTESRHNPITQLFMRFIFVVALLIPFVIISAQMTNNIDILILGLAIFAGLVWVPHGWGADDPAGLIHFILRAVLCYAAFLFSPEETRGAVIAGAAAVTYVYAMIAMKKPSRERTRPS